MSLVNAYAVSPADIKPGDEMVFVVKAMVVGRDEDGKLKYRLYRCLWEGGKDEIPQGSRIRDGADERICRTLFPSLAAVANEDWM